MKTLTQAKFDLIIKDGFHQILKPLGFIKKGNNFYLQKPNLGHIINVQKSSFGSKDNISFTINTGIFIPEYWNVFYNYNDEEVPKFPIEPVCILRRRIGNLNKQGDTWYEIDEKTDSQIIIEEMRQNLRKFILPHFDKILDKKMLIGFLDEQVSISAEKLIIYGEYNLIEKAMKEYQRLLNSRINSSFRCTIKEYGLKYGLVSNEEAT